MRQTEIQVLGLGEVLWDMLPEGKRCGGAPAWCGEILRGGTPEQAMQTGTELAARVAGQKGAMF